MSNKDERQPLVSIIKRWYRDVENCYFSRVEIIKGKLKLTQLYHRPLTKYQEIKFLLDSHLYLSPDGHKISAMPLKQFLATKDFFK